MDLRKLDIFSRVARLKSFSRAAEDLHMAQPAVSIAVRKLEESLGVTLLDRSGREVTLTAEGNAVLARAHVILQEAEELLRTSDAMGQLLQGQLNIACPSMLATYYLPDVLAAFLGDHPGLKAAVTQAGTNRVEQMLLDDSVEIGVTTISDSAHAQDLELIPLIREEIMICVADSHPWATRAHIDIPELADTPMVVYESGYFIRNTLDELCAAAGVQPSFRVQTNFLPLIIRMVEQQLGVTVGLKMMVDQEPGVVGIPLAGNTGLDMALAKRRGRTISGANQAFLDWAAFKL